ncbi:uncharacterized protein LOC132258129 [Phlebotomus argentipes]|uniref:uncharacterized protein LOC132258129 n=1 Tax=Phlebotomus argentipes TaxID=94469 RepID=UPI00289323A7|nr:uncharacterized protein LOC132258129 [Phlebotomus argentipes]
MGNVTVFILFIFVVIGCIIYILCKSCDTSGEDSDDSEEPIHRSNLIITSSGHIPLRETGAENLQPRGPPPIGFTAAVRGSANIPDDEENPRPTPVFNATAPPESPSSPDDMSPPSYEAVMRNEALYKFPDKSPNPPMK